MTAERIETIYQTYLLTTSGNKAITDFENSNTDLIHSPNTSFVGSNAAHIKYICLMLNSNTFSLLPRYMMDLEQTTGYSGTMMDL